MPGKPYHPRAVFPGLSILLAEKSRSRAGTYLRRLKLARIHRRFSRRLFPVSPLVAGGTMPSRCAKAAGSVAPQTHCLRVTEQSKIDGRARPELFVKDRLHFSPEGYKMLAERVRPFLAQ